MRCALEESESNGARGKLGKEGDEAETGKRVQDETGRRTSGLGPRARGRGLVPTAGNHVFD